MKESYITKNFKKTAAARFPVQAEQLNAAFYARLQALRQDNAGATKEKPCLLYTSPSPRDRQKSRMPSSA